jgi:hypothetical protein
VKKILHSVLDLAPIRKGGDAALAFRNTRSDGIPSLLETLIGQRPEFWRNVNGGIVSSASIHVPSQTRYDEFLFCPGVNVNCCK